ncbi:hypothetical protein WG907_04455 [Sphingobium sp. AN558]|uniref:hypothetical protein n=1 Tax=Sphingobium sp. AN558 TaxID=3133442 RepID=UPI0030BE2E6E
MEDDRVSDGRADRRTQVIDAAISAFNAAYTEACGDEPGTGMSLADGIPFIMRAAVIAACEALLALDDPA